jgi:hypothetical protein
LESAQITGHPLTFVDDDALIAPWDVTELVVITAACLNTVPVLEYVASEERRAQREAVHGRWSRGGRRGSDYFFEPEACQEMDQEVSPPLP